MMAMVMTIIGFAQAFADMGVSNSIISKLECSSHELSSLYWFNILTGVVFFLLVWFSSSFVVTYYNEPRLGRLIHVLSPVFLIIPIGRQFRVLLQKELRFQTIAKIEIAGSLIASLIAVWLALDGSGVLSLVFWQISFTTATTIILTYIGLQRWKPRLYFKASVIKGHIRFGLFQTGENLLNTLTTNIDYILIGRYVGAAPLGLYSIARQLVNYPFMGIERLTGRVLYSVLSVVQKEKTKFEESYSIAFHYNLVFLLPAFILLMQFAEPVISTVYGPKWLAAATTLKILCVVSIIKSLGLQGGAVLLAKGKANISFYWKLVWTPALIVACFTGIKIGNSIESVAWSLLGATLSFDCLWHYLLIRVGHLNYWKLARGSAGVVVASIGMVMFIQCGLRLGMLPSLKWLTWLLITGATVYVFLYWLLDKKKFCQLVGMLRS